MAYQSQHTADRTLIHQMKPVGKAIHVRIWTIVHRSQKRQNGTCTLKRKTGRNLNYFMGSHFQRHSSSW